MIYEDLCKKCNDKFDVLTETCSYRQFKFYADDYLCMHPKSPNKDQLNPINKGCNCEDCPRLKNKPCIIYKCQYCDKYYIYTATFTSSYNKSLPPITFKVCEDHAINVKSEMERIEKEIKEKK